MKLKDSYICLRGLRFHAYHGVAAQERLVGNDYEVDVRLHVDVEKAMVSDDVATRSIMRRSSRWCAVRWHALAPLWSMWLGVSLRLCLTSGRRWTT